MEIRTQFQSLTERLRNTNSYFELINRTKRLKKVHKEFLVDIIIQAIDKY